MITDVDGGGTPSGVWLYYRKYCLSECVPTGYEVAGCVAKASFSPSESLREAIVTELSFVAREMALYDLLV